MIEISLDQLAKCDGNNGRPLYLSVRGVVYDVGRGKNFYGPGGPYSMFAGKECARALACMVKSIDYCDDDLSQLGESELGTLHMWETKFKEKYKQVGKLIWSCHGIPSNH